MGFWPNWYQIENRTCYIQLYKLASFMQKKDIYVNRLDM